MTTQLSTADKRTLAQHKATITAGVDSFFAVGKALFEILEDKLYLAEADTFDEFCRKNWGFTPRRAKQLVDSFKAVETVKSLESGTNGSTQLPMNERQARVLAALPTPQAQADVWAASVETAPKKSDGTPRVTAAHVAKVAAEKGHREPAAKPAPKETPKPAATPEPNTIGAKKEAITNVVAAAIDGESAGVQDIIAALLEELAAAIREAIGIPAEQP